MIVLDTSIFVDYLFEKNEKRKEIARKMLGQLEGKEVAVPKVFLIELISIGRRLGFKIKKGRSRILLRVDICRRGGNHRNSF